MSSLTPIIIPVRHHSPACARLVRDVIRSRRPQVVLVEGPSDANALIPALLDPATLPPVALMAYFRPGKQKGPTGESSSLDRPTLFYPFCDYSPEWVALREGHAAGAEVHFCDLPAGPMLLQKDDPPSHRPDLGRAIAGAYGFQSHEEWWESLFEGQHHSNETLMQLLLAYGEEVAGPGDPITTLREEWMWQQAEDAIRDGATADRVVIVCGAAHAVRLPALAGRRLTAPKAPPVELALTPYTFEHLSRRSGYGAGNQTPMLFQRTWLLGDLGQAAAASLVQTGALLNEKGWSASTADAIAAFATATQLAGLRDKAAPGAAEIRLAARTAWAWQDPGLLEKVMDEVMIGSAAGAVAESAGETPLAADFYGKARRFWRILDATDRDVRLRLSDPQEREQSIFLHQLRVSEIPFAELRDYRSRTAPGASLWTRYEAWVRHWTPQTAIGLAERAPLGASVAEVAREVLLSRLHSEAGILAALTALVDAAASDLEDLLLPAMQVVDAASVTDLAWEDLARSTTRLMRLEMDAALPPAIRSAAESLAARLYDRACLHLAAAARCSGERTARVAAAISELHESVIVDPALDSEAWWRALHSVLNDPTAHPTIAGLAASLIWSGGRISQVGLMQLIRLRLSPADGAEEGAAFVDGILSLNRNVLLQSRELAATLNVFVRSLRSDQFLAALPLLRRSFQGLSRSEMRHFLTALSASDSAADAGLALADHSVQDAIPKTRDLLDRLLQEGAGRLEEMRQPLSEMAAIFLRAGSDTGDYLGRCLEDLAQANRESSARRLLHAREALRLLQLESKGETASETGPLVPGLSLLYTDEQPIFGGEREPPGLEEELARLLVDGRRSTRLQRVALVAAALDNTSSDSLAAMLPLLAHGDYTRLMVRQLARNPAAVELASRCFHFTNALVRRAGIEIAAAALPPDDLPTRIWEDSSGTEILFTALGDPVLWPAAYRILRSRPLLTLEWVRFHEPLPAEVRAGSPEEVLLTRVAMLLSRCPAAIPWLRSCQEAPDRLALEAAASLALLGFQSEEDFRWTIKARVGSETGAALLRYELESRSRAIAGALDDMEEDLAGSLDLDLLQPLLEKLAGARHEVSLAPWIEALGRSRAPEALGAICPFVTGSHPLLASTAAAALGIIGGPQALPYLLGRRTPRGSDADRAMLQALAQIGDLRVVEAMKERLRSVRPEEVMPEELAALEGVGEPLALVLPAWLEESSPTLQAAAETLLERWEPALLKKWIADQPPAARVGQLCARLLLPGCAPEIGGDSPSGDPVGSDRTEQPPAGDLETQLEEQIRLAGSAAVRPVVHSLQRAAGPAEATLVRILERLKMPLFIIPVLRLSRSAPWKLSIPLTMGDEAVPQLTLALRAPEPHVVLGARAALHAIGTPAALAALASCDGPAPKQSKSRRSTRLRET